MIIVNMLNTSYSLDIITLLSFNINNGGVFQTFQGDPLRLSEVDRLANVESITQYCLNFFKVQSCRLWVAEEQVRPPTADKASK